MAVRLAKLGALLLSAGAAESAGGCLAGEACSTQADEAALLQHVQKNAIGEGESWGKHGRRRHVPTPPPTPAPDPGPTRRRRSAWNYDTFEIGNWSEGPGDGACDGEGKEPSVQWQAPIMIDTSIGYPKLAGAGPVLHDVGGGCKEAAYKATGYTWQVDFTTEGKRCTDLYLEWKGKAFELLQFHIHVTSEDEVDFKPYDAQIHMVHASADGEVVAFGALLYAARGKDTPFVKEFLSQDFQPDGPVRPWVVADPAVKINPYQIFSAGGQFWHYLGSLTTPPCVPTEINFMTVQNPIPVDPADLQRFRDYLKAGAFADSYGSNARPPQPLNSRQVSIGRVGDITTLGEAPPAFSFDSNLIEGV